MKAKKLKGSWALMFRSPMLSGPNGVSWNMAFEADGRIVKPILNAMAPVISEINSEVNRGGERPWPRGPWL